MLLEDHQTLLKPHRAISAQTDKTPAGAETVGYKTNVPPHLSTISPAFALLPTPCGCNLSAKTAGEGIPPQAVPADAQVQGCWQPVADQNPEVRVQPVPDGFLIHSSTRRLSDNMWGDMRYRHSGLNLCRYLLLKLFHSIRFCHVFEQEPGKPGIVLPFSRSVCTASGVKKEIRLIPNKEKSIWAADALT